MAELVDALGSGPSGGNTVEVRVLFWAPGHILQNPALRRIHCLSAMLRLSLDSTSAVFNPPHLLPPSFFRQEFHRGLYQETGKGQYVEINKEDIRKHATSDSKTEALNKRLMPKS